MAPAWMPNGCSLLEGFSGDDQTREARCKPPGAKAAVTVTVTVRGNLRPTVENLMESVAMPRTELKVRLQMDRFRVR